MRKRQEKAKKRWQETAAEFEEYTTHIKNPKGKSRTFEENKMLLLALKASLRRQMEAETDKTKVSWSAIDREVAEDFGCKLSHLVDIRQHFFESEGADVLVMGEWENEEDNQRGRTNNNNKQKVKQQHLLAIVEYVDLLHSKGSGVTCQKISNHLKKDHHLEISRTQVRYSMRKLQLSYQAVKKKRRNTNSFRPERIRDFVIGYDKIYRKITVENEDKWVFIFTDESYVHSNHCHGNSYFVNGKNCTINQSSSKRTTTDNPACNWKCRAPC